MPRPATSRMPRLRDVNRTRGWRASSACREHCARSAARCSSSHRPPGAMRPMRSFRRPQPSRSGARPEPRGRARRRRTGCARWQALRRSRGPIGRGRGGPKMRSWQDPENGRSGKQPSAGTEGESQESERHADEETCAGLREIEGEEHGERSAKMGNVSRRSVLRQDCECCFVRSDRPIDQGPGPRLEPREAPARRDAVRRSRRGRNEAAPVPSLHGAVSSSASSG